MFRTFQNLQEKNCISGGKNAFKKSKLAYTHLLIIPSYLGKNSDSHQPKCSHTTKQLLLNAVVNL